MRDDLYENDPSRCFCASPSSPSNKPRAKYSGTHTRPRSAHFAPFHCVHLFVPHCRHFSPLLHQSISAKHVGEYIGAERVRQSKVSQNLEAPALLSVLHGPIMCSHVLCIPTLPGFVLLVSYPLQEALHAASAAGGNVSTGFIRVALGRTT